MTISPFDKAIFPTTASAPRPAPAKHSPPTDAFDLVLHNKRLKEEPLTSEKAQAIAELMRLEQMQAVITPQTATEAPLSPSSHFPVTQLIEAYLSHSPGTAAPQATPREIHRPQLTPSATLAETTSKSQPTAIAEETSLPKSLEDIITQASRKYGVDDRLIRSVIKAESNFNPKAVSRAGAQGLMQLMPATARGLGVTNSFDPYQNVMAGTRFLKDMLGRYGGNVDTALAAYNWGPGNVDRNGTTLPRETREYLVKVKSYYQQMG